MCSAQNNKIELTFITIYILTFYTKFLFVLQFFLSNLKFCKIPFFFLSNSTSEGNLTLSTFIHIYIYIYKSICTKLRLQSKILLDKDLFLKNNNKWESSKKKRKKEYYIYYWETKFD